MPPRPRVALIADFDASFPPHSATEDALRQAAEKLGVEVEPVWIGTNELEPGAAVRLAGYAGLWIAPGSPYRSLAGVLDAIRYARENNVTLLGTCGGFQHVVLEYARNVLSIADATHAEYDPYASRLFISRLVCPLVGKTMEVRLARGSRAAEAYGKLVAEEQYYCNFGISPAVVEELFGDPGTPQTAFPGEPDSMPAQARGGADRKLVVSGTDQDGEPRVIELPGHPLFLATLYVPQMRSSAGQPHPLVTTWLAATCQADC